MNSARNLIAREDDNPRSRPSKLRRVARNAKTKLALCYPAVDMFYLAIAIVIIPLVVILILFLLRRRLPRS